MTVTNHWRPPNYFYWASMWYWLQVAARGADSLGDDSQDSDASRYWHQQVNNFVGHVFMCCVCLDYTVYCMMHTGRLRILMKLVRYSVLTLQNYGTIMKRCLTIKTTVTIVLQSKPHRPGMSKFCDFKVAHTSVLLTTQNGWTCQP